MDAARINTALRRVSPTHIYALLFLPLLWLTYRALTGGLGVDPIEALEHELGQIALQLLVAGLAVTPLRRLTGISLLRYRRAFGLMAFLYVALHLLVWLVLDVQLPAQIWADIVKRPFITIGMIGFALMLPLAATSNDWSVRKLGRRWRRLHKLTYGIVLLGATHFVLLTKTWQLEPLIYLFLMILLLSLRLPARRISGFLRESRS